MEWGTVCIDRGGKPWKLTLRITAVLHNSNSLFWPKVQPTWLLHHQKQSSQQQIHLSTMHFVQHIRPNSVSAGAQTSGMLENASLTVRPLTRNVWFKNPTQAEGGASGYGGRGARAGNGLQFISPRHINAPPHWSRKEFKEFSLIQISKQYFYFAFWQ